MSKSTPSESPPENGGEVQRWTAKRKAAVVLDLIKGKTTAAETARLHALTVGGSSAGAMTSSPKAPRHPRDLAQQHQAERQRLLAKVGELTLDVDILKKAHRLQGRDLPDGIS